MAVLVMSACWTGILWNVCNLVKMIQPRLRRSLSCKRRERRRNGKLKRVSKSSNFQKHSVPVSSAVVLVSSVGNW